MIDRIEAAEQDYKSRFPDAVYRLERVFEDGDFVFLHAIHNDEVKKETRHSMDIIEVDASGQIGDVQHFDGPFAREDMKGLSLLDGPSNIFDLDKTDSNKAQIEKYFDFTLKFSDRMTRYRELNDPEIWWREPDKADLEFIAAFEATIQSFLHKDLRVYHAFGGDAQQVFDHIISRMPHLYVEEYKTLIGCGNFVFLEYREEGRDFGSNIRQLFSLEDGQIKAIWGI